LNSYNANCEFCRIVRGLQESRIVCETSDCLAFFPTRPVTTGHTLVIPKTHVKDLWSAGPTVAAYTMDAVLVTGQAIAAALKPDGMNIINSAGSAASQTVYHLHVHLVPRWQDDQIGDIWPASPDLSEDTLDEIAELVRRECS
jgi:histidine triad (HIT) family protein